MVSLQDFFFPKDQTGKNLMLQDQDSTADFLGTVMLSLWDEKGVSLVIFLPRQTTVNSNCYTGTLRSLNAHLH
jgi:hypothetical protein